MPIFELYSRRKKHANQGQLPEVYRYDEIPYEVRIQVIGLWKNAIGSYNINATRYETNARWNFIHDTIAHEKGLPELSRDVHTPQAKCENYLIKAKSIEDSLDIIELTFYVIEQQIGELEIYALKGLGISQKPQAAVAELNYRLREAALGYQFENGKIIRIDSQFLHSEVVLPALCVLQNPIFRGAQEEFMNAHAHYRAGEYKDAIVDALNAFESTLKSICDTMNWAYPLNARASDLLKIVRRHKLLPDYLDQAFDQLIATLKCGLPTVRNEEGGHGQGGTVRETPGYIAAYALHLAAANIVLLSHAFEDLQSVNSK